MGSEEGCVILDVRTQEGYDEGQIHGAILISNTEIACCGACEQFPCDTIMTKSHTTVLDKDWLRWKKESNTNR